MSKLFPSPEILSMAFRFFRDPFQAVLIATDQSPDSWYPIELSCGIKIALRASRSLSVPDICILHEILVDDEYMLARTVRKGDTVVDIGAHIGIYSVLAATHCGDGEVLAFEPEESNYRMLQVNAGINPLLPIQTFNYAVSSCRSERQLHRSKTNSGGHTLLLASSDGVPVTSITLGDVLQLTRSGRIGLLKLDCEGSEFEIIASASANDLQDIDRIILEVHDAAYTAPGDVQLLFHNLSSAGFSLESVRSRTYVNEGHFQTVFASRTAQL